MNISIILPALNPGNDFMRCIYSIRTALAGQMTYNIICVVKNPIIFEKQSAPDIIFIKEKGRGIYSAMNDGVQEANGRFIYFIGQDDILLPTAVCAIKSGLEQEADLVVSDVFWGKGVVFRNNPSRKSLVWKNWCHQGVFYDRFKFIRLVEKYPLQYLVQADHYANIIISSVPKIKLLKYNGCVAWYASDGFSSRSLDAAFREDFPELVRNNFGGFLFYTVVVRRFFLKLYKLLVI